MGKAKFAVIACLAVAVVALVLRLGLFGQAPSDAAQIQEALRESIEASKEGRPGSVIALLSEQFRVNGEQPGLSRVAQAVKEYRPAVTILKPEPVVSGDVAEMNTPVKLSIGFPMNRELQIENVTLRFEKESATEWLVIPTKKWHLASVTVPASSLGDLGLGAFAP